MRIPALLPLPFDFCDFFARFFAMAKRVVLVVGDDLRIAVSSLLIGNYLTTRMVQKSCASSGLVRYSYGIVKYPCIPHLSPQEFLEMNHRLESS